MSGRFSRANTLVLGLTVLVTVIGTAACGGPATTPVDDAAGSPSTSGSPSTAPPPPTTTAPTPTTSGPATATNSSETSGETEASDLTPVPGGQRLTLDRFFEAASHWEENRYDVATLSDVQGIASTVDARYSDSSSVKTLELRLENKFDTLSFSAGQDNASVRSDQNLSVEVMANNAQVEIRSIPFNEVRDFEIPVSGVNALQIRMFLDDQVPRCGGSVIGVVMDPILQ